MNTSNNEIPIFPVIVKWDKKKNQCTAMEFPILKNETI